MSTISNLVRLSLCLFSRTEPAFCLSSLVATSYFFKPNNPLFTPKTLLFDDYFALFDHVSHGSRRFYLYHCSGYLCFSLHI